MESRYARQTILKDFGEAGQAKLTKAKVLVVGLGGLGLPVLQYLNAMGVGTLGLMDQDVVELHNLQRQILYAEHDLGKQKLDVVFQKLNEQNSSTTLIMHDSFLTKENALDTIRDYDVVVDATDNFPTRYLINDACVILDKPFVYGALHGFEGHVSVFNHLDGPTYRCLYPNMPSPDEMPNCNENGVLGVVPGIIGTLQALEVVKILTGIGEVLSGKLLLFNGLNQHISKIGFKPNSENKNIKKLQEFYEPLDCEVISTVSAETFQTIRESESKITLIDVRTEEEFEGHHLEEALHLPLNQINQYAPTKGDMAIYVICQSGKRSEIAVKHLQEAHPNLTFYSILGGMNKMLAICP
ncbi:HesA/MoeB/ThiF family protein [Flagellimonas sp. S3867]|uniref:HesA/MoeB/ThiF family protein n=1 Tax=Flagellimonas sp. S3867 TaxID=2768063 RepID=UPI001688C779|nr:HesA/MoeB/ThiF family protein [Flagellimonas sp. S3867]